MNLRDYQTKAIEAACTAWDAGAVRVLLVLATGLGKTIIFATIAKLWQHGGRGRVLVIAPSIELVDQAARKIEQVTGETPAIEQAENWSNEDEFVRSEVVVSCKASLVSVMRDGRKRYERLKDISLVVIDEAHYSATADYAEILDHFDCKVLGVTATPKRHDKVRLSEVYDSAPYVMGIQEGVESGWLCKPRIRCLQLASLDLSAVKTNRAGDFTGRSLGEAMEGDDVVFEVAEAIARESRGEKTLGFTASVDQAMKVANVLADTHGINAEWVCGDKSRCPDTKRREVLSSFRGDAEGVQVVMNCGVLTTGFDFPGLRHIVNARPTKSLTLFTQMFGRGTRTLDGVVDFEGSTPESRKAAIAASSKPDWRWTDLRDTAMRHELVTPIDVLGGQLSIQERERALKLAEDADEDRDVGDLIAEAAEHVREQEAAERARLAKLRAQAAFEAVDIDPFQDAFRVTHEPAKKERGARMPFGKHRGELIRDIDPGYLAYMRREGYLKTNWLRKAVDERLGIKEAATA